MKKLLLFVTMAASLLFTQCKKDDKNSMPSAGKPVEMTVTVGPGSKTDITASTGGITWSTGDKLYVGYGGKYVGYLTLAGGVGTPTGTFTGSVGLTDADEGKELTFHFYYLGSADHTSLAKGATSVEVDFSSQNIIKGTDGKLTNASLQHVCYGSAKGTVTDGTVTDINVMLVSKVAIAHFSFKNNGAIGNGNPYTGALKLSGTNICNKMTVNFNSEGFSCTGTAGDISLTNTTSPEKYVMLVPTSSTTGPQTLTFTGSVKGETTLENGIRPNKFYGLDGAIEVQVKPKFSVAANKTVEFSKGNLWYNNGTFSFEPNQWNYTNQGSWDSQHVNHFLWSPNQSIAVGTDQSVSGQETDVFFTNATETTANPSFQVTGETEGTWRTLNNNEWRYLLGIGDSYRADAANLRAWVTLDNGVNGLVILPDGSTVAASSVKTKALVASYGAVFLPAAGYRHGSGLGNVGSNACYCSSTPDGASNYYYVSLGNGIMETKGTQRYYGSSTRLVRDL